MSRRDVLTRLRDMLDYSREACAMASGKSRSHLNTDRQLNLSLVRLLEIIGEAASQIPPVERGKWPQIRWQAVVGLRNRLIHKYHEVDLDIVWEIISNDLPPLIHSLNDILTPEEPTKGSAP